MRLNIKDNIVILSHYYKRAAEGGGPPQDLRDFLVPKVKYVAYIEHPFPYADDHRSSMTIYENGKLKTIHYTFGLKGPTIMFYIMDIFFTWYFLILSGKTFQLCLALDNLNTVSVLPFKWLKKINHLIFYTIDYTPKRFTNPILNSIYLISDRIACKTADSIWVLSERMRDARRQAGVNSIANENSITVPMGAKLARIKHLPFNQIKRYQLIFVGHLLEKQGLQLIIEALPKIHHLVPKVSLAVIGQGNYEPALRKLAIKNKVNQLINWHGFVNSHSEVETLLCESAIGLAPYIPSDTNYTFFTDPGKPKLYLGCGLPVIITDFPASAKIIADAKAGIIVNTTVEDIAQSITSLLTDDKLYKQYRQNALNLATQYDTDTLLSKAIEETKL